MLGPSSLKGTHSRFQVTQWNKLGATLGVWGGRVSKAPPRQAL